MAELLALSMPPLQMPTTIGLPKTPTGGSPGALILTVFAMGLDTLAQYAAQKIIPKPKTEQELLDDARSDNKHVVKMKDVAAVIDAYLNQALNLGLIGRTAAQMFTGKTPKQWITPKDFQKQFEAQDKAQSDAEWMTIREELKRRIRQKELQQKNTRSELVEVSMIRLGKLHENISGQKRKRHK